MATCQNRRCGYADRQEVTLSLIFIPAIFRPSRRRSPSSCTTPIGLDDEEIATITGVQPETAHRWLTTEQTPRAGETLEAVVGVIRLLGEPLTSGRVRDFMRAPATSLQHRTPIAALGDGHINLVASAAAAAGSASRAGRVTPALRR